MSDVPTLRRYYLLKRIATTEALDFELAAVWQAKQEGAPGGVTLPATFPSIDALLAAGYEASEDLNGADCRELVDHTGISDFQARDVLAAAAAL